MFMKPVISLHNLGILYHVLCEESDRKICTIRNEHNEAIPRGREEFVRVNKYALRIRDNIFKVGLNNGYPVSSVREAIKSTSWINVDAYLKGD